MITGQNTRALALAFLLLPGLAFAQVPQNSDGMGGARPLPLTPSQMEGPYYPVTKQADQDNDLTRIGPGPAAQGTILNLSGRVIDKNSRPVTEVSIELWQTDMNGIYMHPNDSRTDQRDRSFQFFGRAKADNLGRFEFRTIMPGIYGTRPRHLHVKIIRPGSRTLTTQLYFKGDERLTQDFLTRRLGERLAALLLEPRPQVNGELHSEIAFVLE